MSASLGVNQAAVRSREVLTGYVVQPKLVQPEAKTVKIAIDDIRFGALLTEA